MKEVKRLNEATKRNIERFPGDFMFQLTQGEWKILRSQIATAKMNISKVRYPPYVFTEHGVLMLSNVLNSTKAVKMSIQIIRIFDKLRKYAFSPLDIFPQSGKIIPISEKTPKQGDLSDKMTGSKLIINTKLYPPPRQITEQTAQKLPRGLDRLLRPIGVCLARRGR